MSFNMKLHVIDLEQARARNSTTGEVLWHLIVGSYAVSRPPVGFIRLRRPQGWTRWTVLDPEVLSVTTRKHLDLMCVDTTQNPLATKTERIKKPVHPYLVS